MLMHDYGGWGGGWPYDDISKNNFFSQSEIVLKQKKKYYLLYIFVITIASIHFHSFPLDPSRIVKAYVFFICVSLICIIVNNF